LTFGRLRYLSTDNQGNVKDGSRTPDKDIENKKMDDGIREGMNQPDNYLSKEASGFVNALRDTIGSDHADSLMAKVIANVTHGTKNVDKAIMELAEQSHLKPEQAVDVANHIVQDLATNVTSMAAQKSGVSFEAIENFFMNDLKPDARSSLLIRMLAGDPRVAEDLAERYKLGNKY
jgi:hypothetical protein